MMDEHLTQEQIHSINVPIDIFVDTIATKAALLVIEKHIGTCPLRDLASRLEKLEARFNILLGAILGSGVLGGVAGALIGKLIP